MLPKKIASIIPSGYCHQCKIDDDGRDEAGDGIDEIMRLNIYGSQKQDPAHTTEENLGRDEG